MFKAAPANIDGQVESFVYAATQRGIHVESKSYPCGDHSIPFMLSALPDFFARFGGEEFVLVLPETDEHSAKKIAERCRSIIFKEQIPHGNSKVSHVLTISLGVGTIVPSHKDEPISFIEEVDKRLYQAKQKGRNCIVEGN